MAIDNVESVVTLAEEWRAMERRLEAHAAIGGCDLGTQTFTIDPNVYTDPARFAAERRELFQRTPLLACLSAEIADIGAVLPFDAAGTPIIVVRTGRGTLRAYLNICMHRGARLVSTCRRSQFLTCPFHAWSFNLDGELVNIPQANAFAGVDTAARRLIEIPVAEAHGMVFVRPQVGGDAIDVAEHLGSIAPLFDAFELPAAQLVKTEQFAVQCNWKLALDTFCEAYHIPASHPQTLAPQLIPYVTIQDEFDHHARYANPAANFANWVGKPEAEWPHSNYNAVHYLYPNTIFTYTDAFDGSTPVYAVFRLFPGATVGDTIVLASTYRPASAAGVEQLFAAAHDIVINIIKNEDFRIVTDAWRNLFSMPPGHKLIFGRNESLLQRYHRRMAAAIGMPLA